ncbi:hypothetical protein [Amycolatopsis alba]|uniref:Uncharacterized protein n=1 Tax=Amycolatopsis alba DSM 44262 TaxID=1125972 RepID=A0A229RKX0_AMYAL|nr:hypothetical protein [Amycolatopsis alba]OXM47119.1 hypothetical protein CFP75_25200 [Amycolatopsis alba DSM 44262]
MSESIIDPDLVLALHEAVRQGAPASRTGVRLTARGWAVGSWTGESAYPVALTGADLPDEVDFAVANTLCVPKETDRSHYGVPDEQGDFFPGPDGEAVFVTGRLPWTGAWWFDPSTARRVVRDEEVESLWLTAGGVYVSERAGDEVVWAELNADQAVRRVYAAGAEHDEDCSSDLVRAARHARDAVATLTGAIADLPGAVAAAETAAALSALVRTIMVTDLRAARAHAARHVYEFTDRDMGRAAPFLRLGRSAAENLIKEGLQADT